MSEQDEHKEQMQAMKAEHRKKIAEKKNPDRGLVLVNTGDGKGKSSSAFGVVARALGWDKKVAVVQFTKGTWKTGEAQFFARFPDQVDWHTMGEGFTWETQNREQDTAAAEKALEFASGLLASGEYFLVVLDEINIVLRYDYLAVDAVLDALDKRADTTHVILTGRDAKPELIEYADLVSEIASVKHPFDNGIKAQRGIDF